MTACPGGGDGPTLDSQSGGSSVEMPDAVRRALLKILCHTLLSIRGTESREVSFALADHAHNLPDLIASYSPDTFRYYWEVERPCFLREMERLGQPMGSFQEPWSVLERLYESLPHHDGS